MSVAVDLDRLAEEIERFGPVAYVLTVDDADRPHAVHLPVLWDNGAVTASVGKSTAANATARSAICLLWSPTEEGGYSLLVDGTASVDGDRLSVEPSRAILHRTRDGKNDCVKIEP